MIYTVIYASFYERLYTEVKVCFTEDEAVEVMSGHVCDICETEGLDYMEEYDGQDEYSYFNSFSGHSYNVKLVRQQTGNDGEVIDKFIAMLNNDNPDRFDMADQEHLHDKVKETLEYLDAVNETEQ